MVTDYYGYNRDFLIKVAEGLFIFPVKYPMADYSGACDLLPEKVVHVIREKMINCEKGEGGQKMKKSNYTEEQIAFAVKAGGIRHTELGGVPEDRDLQSRCFYRWKASTVGCD